MPRAALGLIVLFLAARDAWSQAPVESPRPADYASWNVPVWAARRFDEQKLSTRYALALEVNPFIQRGDFDGDGKADVALLVRELETGKRGVLIFHQARSAPYVLGAGTTFGNGGDDWSWLWVWRVESGARVSRAFPREREVLYVSKPEAAGGILYWDGERYRWLQWGD